MVEDEDEILFPIIDKNAQMVSNDSRHTNTPKSYNSGTQYISKFVPRDQEDVDDDDLISNTFENNKYNHEEAELDIDQITMRSMSFVSRATDRIGGTSGLNDDLKLPDVIKEGDEDEEKSDFADMNMNGDDGLVNIDYDNHLSPHIIDDDADSGDSRNLSSADLDNGMDEVDPVPMDDNRSISSSESIEFQPSAFQSPPPFDDARSPTPPKTKFEQQDEDDDIEIDGTPLPNRDSSTQIRTFQPYHKHASVPARDLYSHSHGIQSFQPDRRRSQHVTPTWQQQTQPHINVHPNHSPSHTTPSPHENMNGGLVQRQSLNSSHSKNSKRSRNSGNSKNSRYSGNSSRSKQGQQQQPQQHSQLRLEHNVYSVPTPNLHMNEDMMMHDPLASVGLYGDEDINAGNLFSDSQVKLMCN